MKKITTFIILIFSINTFSQTPQGINYQSIIRNSAGVVIPSTSVLIEFKLYAGLTGTLLYFERHTVTTNTIGMANLIIGQGNPISGTFNTINWSNGIAYEVFVNSNLVGTKQIFMSVPYALFADKAASAPIQPLSLTGNVLTSGPTTNSVNLANPGASTTLTPASNGNVSVFGTAPSYTIGAPNYSISAPTYNTLLLTNGVNPVNANIPPTPLSLINGTLNVGLSNVNLNDPLNGFWSVNGNAVNSNPLSFIGTTDNTKLFFKTNGTSRMEITPLGNFGVNVSNPLHKFHIINNGNDFAGLYAENSFGNNLSTAHGVFGKATNTNSLVAGIYGENSGNGPSIFGLKKAIETGIAGRFEILNPTNAADAIFAKTSGNGYALHAVSTTSTNAGLFDGDVKINGDVIIPSANSYSYSSAKTNYYSISAPSFSSERPKFYLSDGIVAQIYSVATNTLTLGFATYFTAAVNLPNGSTITKLEAYVIDNSSSANISTAQLWRSDSPVGGAGTGIIIGSTVGTSGTNLNIQVLTDNTITSAVVDNLNYAYYVRYGGAYAGIGNEADIKLVRFLITYTITKVD